MLLSRKAIQTALDFVNNGAYSATAQKVMNATVQLKGTDATGGFFVGSGVILGVGKEVSFANKTWTATTKEFTVIVSALHNLYINGDKTNKIPPRNVNALTWDQGMATSFASGVEIKFGPAPLRWGEAPSKVAAIDQVVPIFPGNIGVAGKIVNIPKEASGDDQPFQLLNLRGATNADGSTSGGANDGRTPVTGTEAVSWSYDVVLLLSKNADLYAYANSPACNFMGGKTLQALSADLVPDWNLNHTKCKVPVLGRSYRLLQLGYGMTSDPKVKLRNGKTETRPEKDKPLGKGVEDVAAPIFMTLQYKRALPLATSYIDFYYLNTEFKLPNSTQLVLADQKGILLNCQGGNNSTFSGDSGGPVIAFPVAGGTPAYLVGVNSGAGVAPSESVARQVVGPGKGTWEYDNNVVTSMGLIYAQLPDLRFQNV
jgi:hypothetical protein